MSMQTDVQSALTLFDSWEDRPGWDKRIVAGKILAAEVRGLRALLNRKHDADREARTAAGVGDERNGRNESVVGEAVAAPLGVDKREAAIRWLRELLTETRDADEMESRSLWDTAPSYVQALLAAAPAASPPAGEPLPDIRVDAWGRPDPKGHYLIPDPGAAPPEWRKLVVPTAPRYDDVYREGVAQLNAAPEAAPPETAGTRSVVWVDKHAPRPWRCVWAGHAPAWLIICDANDNTVCRIGAQGASSRSFEQIGAFIAAAANAAPPSAQQAPPDYNACLCPPYDVEWGCPIHGEKPK